MNKTVTNSVFNQGFYGFGIGLMSNQISYYVTYYNLATIFVYDENWKYASQSMFKLGQVAYMITIGNCLYITGDTNSFTNVWQTDSQLNILEQYYISNNGNNGKRYRGIYHDSTSNLIFVVSLPTGIDIFNLNLTLNGSTSTSPYWPWFIAGYNNSQLYVGTTGTTGFAFILVIVNNQVINKLTACQGTGGITITSILLDEFNNMAAACTNKK